MGEEWYAPVHVLVFYLCSILHCTQTRLWEYEVRERKASKRAIEGDRGGLGLVWIELDAEKCGSDRRSEVSSETSELVGELVRWVSGCKATKEVFVCTGGSF